MILSDLSTEVEVTFTFSYLPGSAATGHSGPPEDYDPGSGPELGDITLHFNGQAVLLTGSAYDAAVKIIEDGHELAGD